MATNKVWNIFQRDYVLGIAEWLEEKMNDTYDIRTYLNQAFAFSFLKDN